MKWILLVVFTTAAGNGGVSITSVNGFETQVLCESAGKKATTDLRGFTAWIRYSCVQASNAPATTEKK